jgi:hypothetical protein
MVDGMPALPQRRADAGGNGRVVLGYENAHGTVPVLIVILIMM